MTIGQLYKEGITRLKGYCDSPSLEAGILLAHLLKKEKWYLFAHIEEEVSLDSIETFLELIQKRLEGRPIQHLTGVQEFMSLPFYVNEHVLIPRPETELLVEEVIRFIAQKPGGKVYKVLDMCTGSGCIAISIAKSLSNVDVTAVDISPEALKVAKKTAENLECTERVEFVQSNLFEGLEGEMFDVIVSNPPYVETKEIQTLQKEVKDFEPVLALDGGEDGLKFYREIIKDAKKYLNPEGLLAFEIGWNQAKDIEQIVNEIGGYGKFEVLKDFAGKDRVVIMKVL